MAATIKVFLHVDHIHLTNISTFNFNFNAFNAFCNIPYTQPGNDDKAPIHDRNCISDREMVFPDHEDNGAEEEEEMIEDKEVREEKREQRKKKRTKRHGKKRRSRKETAKEEKVEKENKKKQKKKKEEKNKEQKEEEKVKQKKKKDKKKEEKHKRKEDREEQKKKKDEGEKGKKEKREEPEEEGQGGKEEEEHQKKEEEQDEQEVKEKEEGKTGETKKNKKKRKVRGKNRVKEQETGETNGNNAKTLSRKDSHHRTKKGSTKEDKLRLPAQPSPSRKFDSDKTEANQRTLAYKQFQDQGSCEITTTTEENADCHSWLTTATKESTKRELFVSSRRIFIASTKDIHVWLTTAQAEHSYDSKKELAIIGKIMEYYKKADSYSSWKEYPPDDPKLILTQMVCASNRCLPNDVFENAQKDDTSILSDLEDILTCNM